MEKYQPLLLVQESKQSDTQYDIETFANLLLALNGEQFNLFCKKIILLTEFYDTNRGGIFTDGETDIVDRSPRRKDIHNKEIFVPETK